MSEQAGIGGPIPSPFPFAGVNPIIPQPQFQQPLVMPGPYGN